MGGYLIIVGLILFLVGWLGSVRLAFNESRFLGIWVLLVPVVWLYFLFTRIALTTKYAALSFAGLLIVLLGIYVVQ
jgi:hypothetical protein